MKNLHWRACNNNDLFIPWGPRTSQFLTKRTPLVFFWSKFHLTCGFRPSNRSRLLYEYPTYLSDPLGAQDLNVDPRLQEEEIFDSYHHFNTPSYLPLPSSPESSSQPLESQWSSGSSNGAIGGSTMLSLPDDIVFGYEDEDNSNVLPGHLDWNTMVDGPRRETQDIPFPSSSSQPAPQSLDSQWSAGSSTSSVPIGGSTAGVDATCAIPRQDPVGCEEDSSKSSLLALLFDDDSSVEDVPENSLPLGWEGLPSPPMQGALGSPAPRQSDAVDEAGPNPEDMQPSPAQTHSPQSIPSSTNHLRLQQLDDNFSAPVPSGSSSSRRGAVRTRRTAQQHPTPYTRPDSMSRAEPMSHQPGYLPWTCRWEGCNAIFSTFKELEDHVLRPDSKDKITVSTHNLPRGHSTPMLCSWDDCSATVNAIWRHILCDAHVHVRYECPTCGKSKSRQRRPPPGHCC